MPGRQGHVRAMAIHRPRDGSGMDRRRIRIGTTVLALVLASLGLTLTGRDQSFAAPRALPACGGLERPCQVADGQYYVVMPPDWDGRSRLPAAVYFHGWQSSGAATLRNRTLVQAFTERGHILVLPDGRDKTWAHVGSPSQARDELAFLDAVRADLLARWPVDPDRLWATGFSQGGSMVWDLACYRGRDYSAFAPVSGAFWEPLPADCLSGPVDLRHVHGRADRVVPLAGRVIAQRYRQGDVAEGLALWRRVDGCPAAPARVLESGPLHCRVWGPCAEANELRLCLHEGGHVRLNGWVARADAWVRHIWARRSARLPPDRKGRP